MSTFSKLVSASSTAFSGTTTPDATIPFQPSLIRASNSGATPVSVSFDGGKTEAGVLYPSPHPSAHMWWRQNCKGVWVKNLTSGSTAQVNVMADDGGY